MPTTHPDHRTFLHRLDPYWNVESICPVCVEAIGHAEEDEDLARAEHPMPAIPESLVRVPCFWTPDEN